MTRTVGEIDELVNRIERRLDQLEADPRVIFDGQGFDFQNGWFEDPDQPLRIYLFPNGVAHAVGRLTSPGNGQKTILTLPEAYRIKGGSLVHVPNVTAPFDDPSDFLQVLASGIIQTSSLIASGTANVHFDIWWYTKYPGVF